MSQKPPSQTSPVDFSSPSARAFKRRSLQSPFILNDLSAGDSEHENSLIPEESDISTEIEQEINMDQSFNMDGNDSFKDDGLVIHKRSLNDTNIPNININAGLNLPSSVYLERGTTNNSFTSDNKILASLLESALDSPKLNQNKRYSMQTFSNITNNNPSLTTSATRKHTRSRSTASMNYTPTNAPPSKPSSSNSIYQQTPPLSSEGNNGFSNSPMQSPVHQPFKFNSMIMNNSSENLSLTPQLQGSPQVLPKANYRRGHRYKHSSVSMNMFQDPQRKASENKPHNLPKKYPIPTFNEVTSQITPSQKVKLGICMIQATFVLIAYVAGFHYSNGCLSTLSHILFYDVISNLSSIVVQIMSNFEVWRISSIKYPFGLGRIEVLFGFALSVSLLFVGLDLFSHIVEEMLMNTLIGNTNSENGHEHGHAHGSSGSSAQINPIIYELFILATIFITIFTSHTVNNTSSLNSSNVEKKEDSHGRSLSNIAPNVKRLSSITLKEPIREGLVNRLESFLKSKIGFRANLFHSSTTNLSLVYAFYSLYYPFARGILGLQTVGNVLFPKDSHDEHEHEHELLKRDALEATEWINHASTVIMAVLVSIVAWRLIWRLGNILLLTSPSVDIKRNKNELVYINVDRVKNNTDVEGLIESNVKQLEVFKSSYTIQEIKIARVNTKIYIVIIRIRMPGASDDEEAKFRFYTMRIVRGIMYQCVKGQLKDKKRNNVGNSRDDDSEANNTESIEEENRKSLIDLLNLSTSLEDVEGFDNSGDQFEITIDINRM